MAFPTPPPSAARAKTFMESSKKLEYYEDLYGQRNEDEDFDRFPDQCEDETDGDEEPDVNGRRRVQLGFFKKFAHPKPKESSKSSGGELGSTFEHSLDGEFPWLTACPYLLIQLQHKTSTSINTPARRLLLVTRTTGT